MLRAWWMAVLIGCGSATPTPAAQPAPGPRCLPVVAKDCGCVYTCGAGVPEADHWRVTHPFWNGTPLRARVSSWCAGGACTDVFAAEIVCDGICAPKPADPGCRFDPAGACASPSAAPGR